jgi:hypothetical protein
MTIVYPDGAPDYSDFWLGEVSRIAVNLRKIEIPDGSWGNYEDDADYRERFQQWVDQLWTEKDQLIDQMKANIINLKFKSLKLTCMMQNSSREKSKYHHVDPPVLFQTVSGL